MAQLAWFFKQNRLDPRMKILKMSLHTRQHTFVLEHILTPSELPMDGVEETPDSVVEVEMDWDTQPTNRMDFPLLRSQVGCRRY